jgi:hypothetical protein
MRRGQSTRSYRSGYGSLRRHICGSSRWRRGPQARTSTGHPGRTGALVEAVVGSGVSGGMTQEACSGICGIAAGALDAMTWLRPTGVQLKILLLGKRLTPTCECAAQSGQVLDNVARQSDKSSRYLLTRRRQTQVRYLAKGQMPDHKPKESRNLDCYDHPSIFLSHDYLLTKSLRR